MTEHEAFNALIEHLRKAGESARALAPHRQDQPWAVIAAGIDAMRENVMEIAMAKGGWAGGGTQ